MRPTGTYEAALVTTEKEARAVLERHLEDARRHLAWVDAKTDRAFEGHDGNEGQNIDVESDDGSLRCPAS